MFDEAAAATAKRTNILALESMHRQKLRKKTAKLWQAKETKVFCMSNGRRREKGRRKEIRDRKI